MALNITDLRTSFDTHGWRLGARCIPILRHADAEPVNNFATHCTGHVLYRFYGYDGRLLYLGMTRDLCLRCSGPQGHGRKPWWECVAFATVASYESRDKLRVAEMCAIQAEHPFHNIADAPPLRYHRNGSPGTALWASSPPIFKLADALWQEHLETEPRRDISPEELDPYGGPRLEEGEGLSDVWLYRKPLAKRTNVA